MVFSFFLRLFRQDSRFARTMTKNKNAPCDWRSATSNDEQKENFSFRRGSRSDIFSFTSSIDRSTDNVTPVDRVERKSSICSTISKACVRSLQSKQRTRRRINIVIGLRSFVLVVEYLHSYFFSSSPSLVEQPVSHFRFVFTRKQTHRAEQFERRLTLQIRCVQLFVRNLQRNKR